MLAQVYKNILSPTEISQLIEYFDNKEISVSKHYGNDKDIDFDVKDSVCYNLVRPIIDKILGKDYECCGSAYRETTQPAPLHDDQNFPNVTKKFNRGFLIPLVEGKEFNTVIFDAVGKPDLVKNLVENNKLNPNDFTHESLAVQQLITQLPVDLMFTWKLGDMVSWDTDQLHASTDYSKYGLVKKFIIFFIE